MKPTARQFLIILFICMIAITPLECQDSSYAHLGLESFTTYSGGAIDNILPFTGNLNVQIPLRSFPQKGTLPLSFFLRTNSASWQAELACDDSGDCFAFATNKLSGVGPDAGLLDFGTGAAPALYLSSSQDVSSVDTTMAPVSSITSCNAYQIDTCIATVVLAGFVTDDTGARHSFAFNPADNSLRTTDGTGYRQSSVLSSTVSPLTDSSGNTYQVTNGAYRVSDRNGNTIQRENVYWAGQITDTVGRQIPDINSLSISSSTTGCPQLNIPNEPLIGSATWTVPGLNGTSEEYLFCYTQVNVATHFSSGCPNPTNIANTGGTLEACSAVTDIQAVVLPDGTYWGFVYDTTSSTQPVSYGDLLEIIYPTGGTISYKYATVNSYVPGDSIGTRGIVSRTTNDLNGNVDIWTYSPGAVATVTDPLNNDVVYTYDQSHLEGGIPVATDRTYYQGKQAANIVLKDVSTQYAWTVDPGTNIAGNTNFLPHIVTTTTGAGSATNTIGYDAQSQNEYYVCYYDTLNGEFTGCSSSNVATTMYQMPTSTAVKNYDGTLLKSVSTIRQANPSGGTSLPLSNQYYQANLLDLVANTTKSDSGSSFEESFGYDETNLGPTCICGNQTSHSVVDVTSTYPANRWTTSYYADGMPKVQTDANTDAGGQYPGGTTTFSYDSLGLYPSSTTYPTTGTTAHITSQVKDDNTGLTESSTDENNQATKYFYYASGQEDGNRIQQIDLPDGASINFSYNDTPGQASVTETAVIEAGSDAQSVRTMYVDGFGRTVRTTRNDAYCTTGTITVDTVYDALGRVQMKSSPYCQKSDSTYNATSYQYDALGREIMETHTDGTNRQWCYDGQQIIQAQSICLPKQASTVPGDWEDVSDESGFRHQYVKDALGRMVAATEPPAKAGGSNTTTTYSHNALDLLTGVQQAGASGTLTRTFIYDHFGRLYSATNPESSLVTYSTYDPNGNLISKNDARGVTTSYAYDALNRLLGKTYSGTNSGANVIAGYSLSSCYQYDVNSLTTSGGNLVGRLTNEWTVKGSCSASVPSSGYQTLHSILAYDPLGRVQTENQCTPANCSGTPYSLTLGYDYGGNLTLYTNGTGNLSLTQQFDGANRLLNISSSWNDATHPEGLFNVQTYSPYGMTKFTMGNGISAQRTYDSRMRVTGETAVGVN